MFFKKPMPPTPWYNRAFPDSPLGVAISAALSGAAYVIGKKIAQRALRVTAQAATYRSSEEERYVQ